MTAVVTRFAPSPTGHLHAGNIRVALINWLYSRRHGGRFILRIDDTDLERSKQEYADAIRADLRWLGLVWSEEVVQSTRLDRYVVALETLKRSGRLYPCYETPQELDLKRKARRAAGKPPVYDRAALNLTPAERLALEAEGRRPHWRFKLHDEPIRWTDAVKGAISMPPGNVSDPVLARGDGRPLYTLTSVVDDVELKISHVIRGEDHVANTASQFQIFQVLGAVPPIFSHLALLLGKAGEGLSKRIGSLRASSLRDQGFEAGAITSLLAGLGTSRGVSARTTLDELATSIDLAKFGRSAARFDEAELRALNAKIVRGLPYANVSARLASEASDAFWLAVRGNIETVNDAAVWWRVVVGPITPIVEDAAFAAEALRLLPPGSWDDTTWQSWTRTIKGVTKLDG
ncbi:MAG: glutamate--tRNA ligase, partial [Alphaproteobacteria bacterium]|nr:glutamate--tRNA ligase [Alphaproteobacteria bacterium]